MKVGLYGDSQAEGLAPHLRPLLEARGFELAHVAYQRGRTTAQFIESESGGPYDLDLAIVVLGGNDTASASYPDTLARASTFFRERARKVLWVGPSYSEDRAVQSRHAGARAVQARTLPRLGVVFRDPLNWQQGAAEDHAPDGTHFRRDAYELQAEAVTLEAAALLARPTIIGLAVALAAGLGAWVGIRLLARRRRRR